MDGETEDADSILQWYIKLAKLRASNSLLTGGDYEELFHDDEQIYAYTRSGQDGKITVLINFSGEEASYDASCVENAELLLGTNETTQKGTLAPYEAVIYEEK